MFHNRLTHTQKVAQLSKRIAQHLNWQVTSASGERPSWNQGPVDIDAAEAAGLAHDLGHPPFGHIAEHKLNEKCMQAGTDGFEGNAQTLRIVSKLSIRKDFLSPAKNRGLGLSQKTLDGILKYPWMSTHPNAGKKKKWGAYRTEEDTFKGIRTGTENSLRQSLEASIMDWADDISYAIHDLEDFYRAGFISLERLINDEVAQTEFVAKAAPEYDASWLIASAEEDFQGLLAIMPKLPDFAGGENERAHVNSFGSTFIRRYVEGVHIDEQGLLVVSPEFRKEVHFLKQLTWQFVINDPSLATLQQGQIRVIGELFDALCQWVKTEKRPQRLPTRLRDLIELMHTEDYPSEDAGTARAVADYISSLTEDQALDLHARLHGHTRGSIQDTWVAY